MDDFWKTLLWQQLGAAIDMLEDRSAPFTLDELGPSGLLPERPYTKDELQRYLDHDREKFRALIEAFTDEKPAHHAESHRAKSMVRNFFSTACVTFSICSPA